ncbi:hypothetical protein D3C83_13200 [compost metagenome]
MSPRNDAAASVANRPCTYMSPAAATVPATNSSESPGRNGVTTRPVSQKMMRNRIA